MKDALKIAQLLASRLNHDYVAPLTAISNSCELAKISPDDRDECLDLITQSTESSIEQLKFYRLAFGTFADGEEITAETLKGTIQPIAKAGEIEASFTLSSDVILKAEGKLIALCFMCVQASFTRLRRFEAENTGSEWRFKAEGDVLLEAEARDRIARLWEGRELPSSTNIQFPIFLMLIDCLGLLKETEMRENTMVVRLKR